MIRYIAAIDVGTNSVHMIIALADTSTNIINIVDKEREMLRLGWGLGANKQISQQTINKTIKTLIKFKKICYSKNAIIRAVGTSAVREAKNSDYFIKKIKNETGINIEVISGVEEARLIYKGIINTLPLYDKNILAIDIGGGSTEFIIGCKEKIKYSNSLKMGTVRFTEKYFKNKKFKNKDIERCRRDIKGMLIPVCRDIKSLGFEKVIGSSGTIINTLNISNKLRSEKLSIQFDDFFTKRDVFKIVKLAINAGEVSKMLKIPGLDKKRIDIYLPGILILEGIFRQFGINKMFVSNYALREGLLFDTMERFQLIGSKNPLNLKNNSINSILNTFKVDKKHAYQTAKIALEIFDQIKDKYNLNEQERRFLYFAALLHDIGLTISHSKHHIHSYYIIRNADIIGFTENEKEIIANVARYHRKSHPKLKHPDYSKLDMKSRQIVKRLAGILRIADGLDRMHSSLIQSVKVIIDRKKVQMQLNHKPNVNLKMDICGAETKKYLFEEVYGVKVNFQSKTKK